MTVLDRPASLARDAVRTLSRFGRYGANTVLGKADAIRHGQRGPKADTDDVTLARKVETELFRPPGSPKGKVDVNVADGVVELRGEVKNPAQKKSVEERVRKIPEVRDVNNLLHLPKTPAPTRADAPGRARRTSPESKETPRRSGGRTTVERAVPGAEPSPTELREAGQGRQAAPLGGEDDTA